MTEENGDWKENRKLVLSELEQLNERIGRLEASNQRIEINLTALSTEFRIKASFWGLITGVLGSAAIVGTSIMAKILT